MNIEQLLSVQADLFPSPCGEMGMKRLSFSFCVAAIAQGFPSPCGEMGMKLETAAQDQTSIFFVSVPLRGNGYETLSKNRYAWIQKILKFPSPCGEMGMKLDDS